MSQRQFEDYTIQQEQKKPPIRIVNPKGEDIKLSDRQKNEIYRKARELKEKLRDGMCTKNECWNPTPQNVNKMLKSEFRQAPMTESYVRHMRAIGADPKDINTERLRRR
jgi:hypothetical protein